MLNVLALSLTLSLPLVKFTVNNGAVFQGFERRPPTECARAIEASPGPGGAAAGGAAGK